MLSCGIIATFLGLSRFALPRTDDFADMMYGFQSLFTTGNVYRSAFEVSRDIYFHQQGTFFSCYAIFFLLMKTGTNLLRYQIVIALFMLFFFASVLVLIYTVTKQFHMNSMWGIFLFAILWIALDFAGPGDSMLYLVGACVYILPISFGFLATACYLKVFDAMELRQRILWTVASSVCAFLCSGGVLMAAGMINIVMVLLLLSRWIVNRKFPVQGILPFLAALASALLNALAPGNFTRYTNAYGSRPSITQGVIHTFSVTAQQFLHLFRHTYLLIALVLIAIAILCMHQELLAERFRIHPILVLIGCFVSCYVVMFPSVLGYALTTALPVENRILFTFAWVATPSIIFAWSYLLCWIRVHILPELQIEVLPVTLGGVALFVALVLNLLYVPAMRVNSAPTLTAIYKEYRSGALQQHYAAYHLLLLGAEAAEQESHYVVTYEIPPSSLFMDHHLSADNTWWVNTTLAAVYQLGAFTYGPDHPFTEEDALAAGYTIEQLLP